MASEPEMSLDEAGALLRQELNFHRAKLKLSGAVEIALTAKQQLKALENQKTAIMAGIDVANAKKLELEQMLSGRQAELDAVVGKITASQADLKALNASIADTRASWVTEQAVRDKAQAKASATLDAAIAEKQAALRKLKDELAAVVAGYQAAAGSEA